MHAPLVLLALLAASRAATAQTPEPVEVTVPATLVEGQSQRYELTYDFVVLPFEERVVGKVVGGYRTRWSFRMPKSTGERSGEAAPHVELALSRSGGIDVYFYTDDRVDQIVDPKTIQERIRRHMPPLKQDTKRHPKPKRVPGMPEVDLDGIEKALRDTTQIVRMMRWTVIQRDLLGHLHPFPGETFVLDEDRFFESTQFFGPERTKIPSILCERVTRPDPSLPKIVHESWVQIDRRDDDAAVRAALAAAKDASSFGSAEDQNRRCDELAKELQQSWRYVLDLEQNVIDEFELRVGPENAVSVSLRRLPPVQPK